MNRSGYALFPKIKAVKLKWEQIAYDAILFVISKFRVPKRRHGQVGHRKKAYMYPTSSTVHGIKNCV